MPAEFAPAPFRLALPSLRRTPHIAGALFVALACIYALSPYLALWSLSSALRSHDTDTLAQHIDWSALSASLKSDTLETLLGPPPAEDDLPDFGTSFASGAVSHAIDTHLTPETLMTMASQMIHAPASAPAPGLMALYARISAHFVSPLRFEAGLITGPGGKPTIVHLKFEQWRWKITRFDIPKAA
ncbi:hypothetical protein AA21291_1473 [Swaminathania salitolerans LMG 21291]|uniref:DUF2939 domain-containing protein n=1 Tax=Swaminathania salitolerans TaxID=182838 RepID=A0A511BSG7_9PROT|nr:hypothetical protein AA21291_1473 [Swaminathania salitolerans LMG 21291]GEL03286.1 hypothetical protein SSA02_24490 [Swaminathania salitolerans]